MQVLTVDNQKPIFYKAKAHARQRRFESQSGDIHVRPSGRGNESVLTPASSVRINAVVFPFRQEKK